MKEVICGIYEIVNKANGKKYIGQSIDIYGRFKSHKNHLCKGTSNSTLLQRAWNKYGEDCFEFRVLEKCDEDCLDERERCYIALFDTTNNGYNVESGGNSNKHLSQETRDKLSAAHIGKSLTQETRNKMSTSRIGDKNPMYGKHHTEETKEKIRKNNMGKTGHEISEYQKQRCRESNIGRIVSQETRDKLSKSKIGNTPYNKNLTEVYCVELNVIFENAADASKQLNISSYGILECCRGNRHTCGGYHWKYAEEITNHNEINDLAV